MRLENIVSVRARQLITHFFSERNLKLTQSNLTNLRDTDLAWELDRKLKRCGLKTLFPVRVTKRFN